MNDLPPFVPPRRHSATHILAELYHRCRGAGIESWIDFPVVNPWNRKIRVSAVIVRDGRVACYVWVRVSYNASRNISVKRHRLDRTGIPVVIVRGMMRVPAAMEEIRMHWRAAGGESTPAAEELPADVVGA